MADGDGSPARERPASRQRADTPGRAAEGESAPLEDDEDLRADKRWHTKVNVPRVDIGESFDISEGDKSYSFTRRAAKEWPCDIPGCTKIIGIKLVQKDGVGTRTPVGNIGRGRSESRSIPFDVHVGSMQHHSEGRAVSVVLW